jgi:hypothetical protein
MSNINCNSPIFLTSTNDHRDGAAGDKRGNGAYVARQLINYIKMRRQQQQLS